MARPLFGNSHVAHIIRFNATDITNSRPVVKGLCSH